MALLLLLILFFWNNPIVTSQVHVEDNCKLDTQFTKNLTIPHACTSGSVSWFYPIRDIYLSTFRTDAPYSLCVGKIILPIDRITELTGGLNRTLALPTVENATCTQDVYGRTELKFTSDKLFYYMTAFQYSIVFSSSD